MRKIFVNPNDHRLRAGWRMLLFFILLAGISILGQLAIKAYYGGIPKTTPYLRNALLIIIIAISATAAVFIARRYLDRKTFPSLGLRLNTKGIKDILFGFLLSGVMAASFFFLLLAFNLIEFNGFNWGGGPRTISQTGTLATYLATMSIGALLFFLLMDLVVSWWEELVFRGYLLQNMTEGMGLTLAVAVSCVIYGLIHATNPNAGILSTVIIMGFGFLRIYGYLATQQLWLSFGMHAGWNFFQGHIFGFAASGQETPSWISLTTVGPDWLSGGAFGPEGSVLVLPIVGAALFVMKWWAGRGNIEPQNIE